VGGSRRAEELYNDAFVKRPAPARDRADESSATQTKGRRPAKMTVDQKIRQLARRLRAIASRDKLRLEAARPDEQLARQINSELLELLKRERQDSGSKVN
jgi:hypothetical protein